MPVIEITLIEGYDAETVQSLSRRLTDAVRATIAAPPEGITVVAREVPPTRYMRGGQSRVPGPAGASARALAQEFLARYEAGDLDGARALVSDAFEMVFPSGKRLTSLDVLSEWSKTRYAHVAKTFDGWDESFSGDTAVVQCRGTLSGAWCDGTPFSDIRFTDRLEIRGGRIVRQEVWNDMAEHRPR